MLAVRFLRVAVASAALALPVLAMPAHAWAQGPARDAREDEAAQAFAQGVKAYQQGDFALAASRFAEAHRLLPHPNATWNEARALMRAGDQARAANAYGRYLDEAPKDAPDRADAVHRLDDLARHLLRIDVAAAGYDTVLVDGALLRDHGVYVDPGHHVVEAHTGDQVARKDVDGDAGATVRVDLPAPTPAPAPAPAPTPAPAP
ncbi:MAG TPA: hypothetical protein VIY73_25280, partial [Polyangiaceae bacterium]